MKQANGLLIGLIAVLALLFIMVIGVMFSELTVFNDAEPNGERSEQSVVKTISLQQAEQIALQEISGTVTEKETESENGQLIHTIEIITADSVFDVNVDARTGQILKIETEKIVKPVAQKPATTKKQEPKQTGPISESRARQIASSTVSGRITDVEIEYKLGKQAFVVEIDAGVETDVIIDMQTGEVLGVET